MSARWMSLCCLTATLGALAMTGSARAEACGDQADGCPKGFTCKTYEAGCATTDVDCPPDDAACADKQAAASAECETATYAQCEPAACTSDTECGDGMVCYEQSYEECDGGEATPSACAEGADCAEPVDTAKTEPTCTTKTTKTCAPKYAVPCETATDCGEGFTCVQPESCGCSGSAGGSVGGGGTDPGTGAVDAGIAAKEAALGEAVDGGSVTDNCECKPTEGPKHCEAEEIACDDASDCPDSWTCESYAGDTVCGGAVGRPTIAFADGGEVPYDAGTTFECEPTVETKQCVPPYGDFYGRAEADSSGVGGGAPTSQGGEKGVTGADEDDGSSAAEADAGTGGEEEEEGLCSVTRVGAASQGSNLALVLGLVGLVFAARRRKRS